MKPLILTILFYTVLTTTALKAQPAIEKNMSAYLMVYFKDETHGLYMALSKDGYTFTDVNEGNPIMSGDTVALQKGIRDPHIYRTPNGMFYLAMTDLHIYAQQAGIRNTEWERDGETFGWGNNRSLVLMKSADMIHWDRTILRVDLAFPGLDSIGCAWAPETIYDPETKRLMIYFTMRIKNGINRLYYSYMNNDFTKMETKPKLLFDYPKKGVSYIDGDITHAGNLYHLFYVSHDGVPGIKQARSKFINKGYVFDSSSHDPEPGACEAPTVWKRIGENKWVLMYDVYSANPNNMGFSETTDFRHFTNLGHFNEGVMHTTNFSSPKHGAVIHLTKSEAQQLADYWKLDMKF